MSTPRPRDNSERFIVDYVSNASTCAWPPSVGAWLQAFRLRLKKHWSHRQLLDRLLTHAHDHRPLKLQHDHQISAACTHNGLALCDFLVSESSARRFVAVTSCSNVATLPARACCICSANSIGAFRNSAISGCAVVTSVQASSVIEPTPWRQTRKGENRTSKTQKYWVCCEYNMKTFCDSDWKWGGGIRSGII